VAIEDALQLTKRAQVGDLECVVGLKGQNAAPCGRIRATGATSESIVTRDLEPRDL